MTCFAGTYQKKLVWRLDLDTCVGCHLLLTACKGWNDQGYGCLCPIRTLMALTRPGVS